MIKAYVVTEGLDDLAILKKLLPGDVVEAAYFVEGQGKYGAQSLASSILVVKQLPVVLMMDADKDNQSEIQEQYEYLRDLLGRGSGSVPYKIILAEPEIEVIFFQDRLFIERLAGRKFTDLEWELGQYHPKEFLWRILGKPQPLIPRILQQMSVETIRVLRTHALIKEMSEFLTSVIKLPA